MTEESKVREFLRLSEGRLFHREGQELEFKEQFNLSGLADYFRDFAAFANNRGGYLIFGVKDSPRVLQGMSAKSIEHFEKIDPEKITGFLLDIFSSQIDWLQFSVLIDGMTFGVFKIDKCRSKPVIVRRDEGKNQTLKNGDIYYRYGGRSQKIMSAELERIIQSRIEENNARWTSLVRKIGSAGPENAAILDVQSGRIERDKSRILVLDESLAKKLKFVKEGEFVEKGGAETLKLVGDVVPIDHVEVVKRVKENLTKSYPLSAIELAAEVATALPGTKRHTVWNCIRENDLKNNAAYAAHVFSNKKQEDKFLATGVLPNVPTIYNFAAVDFLVSVLREEAKRNET